MPCEDEGKYHVDVTVVAVNIDRNNTEIQSEPSRVVSVELCKDPGG